MPITKHTVRISKELRVRLDDHVNVAVRELVQAWARAWNQVEPAWEAAIADLVENSSDGRWPTARQISRADKARQAMEIVTREILDLAEFTGVTVLASSREVTGETALWQARLIASQYPVEQQTATLLATLRRVDPAAISAIVERTTETIESRKRPLARDARESMRQALVRGVSLGENPKAAARRMLALSEQRFLGGLSRAVTIARTEIVDAHRSAAAAHHFDHDDVLLGWVWTSELSRRTCPSCWSMHGRVFPLSQPGPEDHQCGRCSRMPQTRSWKTLGFDIEEPPSLLANAEDSFFALPRPQQLTIMGPVRLQALETGNLSWRQLAVKRETPGWRDSYTPIPVKGVRRKLLIPV
jgi:DNA-directed RNA polymerase specialized sigma24 family protein